MASMHAQKRKTQNESCHMRSRCAGLRSALKRAIHSSEMFENCERNATTITDTPMNSHRLGSSGLNTRVTDCQKFFCDLSSSRGTNSENVST